MDFQKKYPLLKTPDDFVLLKWERGYRNVEVYHKDRFIRSVTSKELKGGVHISDTYLGDVQLKFSTKPIAIDVIINGYHSPINITYPSRELKSVSTIFWVVTILWVIGLFTNGIFQAVAFGGVFGIILGFICLVILAAYIVAGLFTRKGKGWAYFLGAGVFTLLTLLYSLVAIGDGFNLVTIFILVIRVVIQFVLYYYLKHAIAAIRHSKYESFSHKEIIDDL